MKRHFKLYSSFMLMLLVMASCIENDPVVWNGSVAEFDAAVWNTPATGLTYPVLTRVPGYGRAVSTNGTAPSTADPLINRSSGTVSFRVNLVGGQQTSDEVLAVSVVSENSTAVAGTHYNAPQSVTIPAGESFGILNLEILNPGPSATAVVVVLQIDGNDQIKPSENYKRIGVSIAQN